MLRLCLLRRGEKAVMDVEDLLKMITGRHIEFLRPSKSSVTSLC